MRWRCCRPSKSSRRRPSIPRPPTRLRRRATRSQAARRRAAARRRGRDRASAHNVHAARCQSSSLHPSRSPMSGWPLRRFATRVRPGSPRSCEVEPAPAAKAALALGLETVGDLLEHLPRDRREARTVAALGPGETATVVVEVRSIRSRPVRRRGMRPLVEATVADETGPMKVTFFNQPWLEKKYGPGTRLVLHGKYEGRNRFRVSSHAPTSEALGGGGRRRALPGHRGHLLDADPRARARAPRAQSPTSSSRCRPHCAPPRSCPTARPPSTPRTSASTRPGAVGSPSTSCCCSSSRCCAAGPAAARAPRRRPSTARATWSSAGSPRRCPSRRPATRATRWRRSTPTSPRRGRCSAC